MKKLSFSISQSSSKPNPIAKKPSATFDDPAADKTSGDANSISYVTEFVPAETLAAQKGIAAIPPLQNEWDWHRHKKMKNLHLPPIVSAGADDDNGSGGIKFEVENPSAAAQDSNITYGLNLRKTDGGDKSDGRDEPNPPAAKEDPLLQRLKFDLKRLPEDRGMAEFEDVPVEGFGAALLAGYGWHEGRGIGKNALEDVKIVEYARRTDKAGLGFVSDVPGGDSKGDGGDKRRSGSGAKAREKDGIVGKEVRIVGGREAGLRGRVVERLGDRKLAVRLAKSEETVSVGVGDVAEIGSREEERCLRRLKEQKAWEDAEKKAKVKEGERREKRGRGGGRGRGGSERKKEANWVMSHIRVRVVSRELRGGGLYLKKGEVVDVVGPGVCDVSMEESREVIQGLSQDVLETVVPRRGGQVLVLLGKHRGVYGSLVERDSERETGVVRDADSHEMVDVRFEQIAEYVGDPSYLGY